MRMPCRQHSITTGARAPEASLLPEGDTAVNNGHWERESSLQSRGHR